MRNTGPDERCQLLTKGMNKSNNIKQLNGRLHKGEKLQNLGTHSEDDEDDLLQPQPKQGHRDRE